MRIGTVSFEGGALRVVDVSSCGAPLAPAPVPGSSTGWRVVGTLRDERIDELSGVVASRRQPDVLWVHNDSGDRPRVFAIGTDGATRAEVRVDGATALDWEDIALGPAPAGQPAGDWVYVADTGDNARRRPVVSIYRFPEPSLDGAGGVREVRAERVDVRYGDGASHDVEAMLVDPGTGDVLLVTKELHASAARIFRVTQAQLAAGSATAELVGTMLIGPRVVGGDVRADGGEVVLRTYDRAWRFERRPGEPLHAALARAGADMDVPDRSEAIGYLPGGVALVSIPEGRSAPIARADLR